jgi:hypothetical protein
VTEIAMKMETIYHVAHDVLPEKATLFADRASVVTEAIEPVLAQVALAGNHPISGDLGTLSVEVFSHLRELVRTFNDSATALDLVADDFVRTNDEARSLFENQQRFLDGPDLPPEPTAPEV